MDLKFHGEWFLNGQSDKPCAIWESGHFLLMTNEKNDVCLAKVVGEGDNAIDITRAIAPTTGGWNTAGSGVLSEDGSTITWSPSGNTWTR